MEFVNGRIFDFIEGAVSLTILFLSYFTKCWTLKNVIYPFVRIFIRYNRKVEKWDSTCWIFSISEDVWLEALFRFMHQGLPIDLRWAAVTQEILSIYILLEETVPWVVSNKLWVFILFCYWEKFLIFLWMSLPFTFWIIVINQQTIQNKSTKNS